MAILNRIHHSTASQWSFSSKADVTETTLLGVDSMLQVISIIFIIIIVIIDIWQHVFCCVGNRAAKHTRLE